MEWNNYFMIMEMKRKRNNICGWCIGVLGGCLLQSCVDNFLPESLDSFDKDAAFTQTMYRPVLGRNNILSDNFSAGNSTQPLTFTISRVVRHDGSDRTFFRGGYDCAPSVH